MIEGVNIALGKQNLTVFVYEDTAEGMATVSKGSSRNFDRFANEMNMSFPRGRIAPLGKY
jgi:hypothetical protein